VCTSSIDEISTNENRKELEAEQACNMALIASAPRLLEACKMMLQARHEGSTEQTYERLAETIKHAENK